MSKVIIWSWVAVKVVCKSLTEELVAQMIQNLSNLLEAWMVLKRSVTDVLLLQIVIFRKGLGTKELKFLLHKKIFYWLLLEKLTVMGRRYIVEQCRFRKVEIHIIFLSKQWLKMFWINTVTYVQPDVWIGILFFCFYLNVRKISTYITGVISVNTCSKRLWQYFNSLIVLKLLYTVSIFLEKANRFITHFCLCSLDLHLFPWIWCIIKEKNLCVSIISTMKRL